MVILNKNWSEKSLLSDEKTIIDIYSSFFIGSLLTGQAKYDYVWIFSSRGGDGSILDFDEGRDTLGLDLDHDIDIANTSLSTKDGELLLYSNGCSIYNSNYQIIENGDGINPGPIHDSWCDTGAYPDAQGLIILPRPNTQDEYHLIHKTVIISEDFEVFVEGILVTNVSFKDNLTGKVTAKNIEIDTGRKTLSSFVEAIQHQNGFDWWVIDYTEGPEEHLYLSYLVTQDTIVLHSEVEIANIASLTDRCSSTSQSCFTPDGTKLAKMCPESGFDLWNFDRSTGLISNYKHLPIETNYVRCGVGISPNSRFAYLSCSDSLWQVDLWEEDLSVGLELIDTLDKSADPFTVTNFGYQQLGPDCKIYMNTIRQYDWLHVINNPDEKGKACDFRQHSIKLPHLNQPGSFPNFPHFRIDEEAICDPTITSVFGVPVETVSGMELFPNPTSGNVTVELPEVVSGRLSVKDLTSQVVLTVDWENAQEMQVDLSRLESGMYLIEVYSGDGRRWVERVLVTDH